MTTQPIADDDAERKKNRFHFDRHTPAYREQFEETTTEMLGKCPVAWSDTYGGAGQQFKEGERLYLSWAMSNRDPAVFDNPNEVELDRTGNRHHSFGLGLHRCIGSNVARMVFKRMLLAVLDRMPDYSCDPAGAVHYDTIGTIQGMKHLPATFTPGPRIGDGLAETVARLQLLVDEQQLAAPVTARKGAAES